MQQMLDDMRVCSKIAGRAWRLMSFPPSYTKLPCTGHCFRIVLPINEMVKAVSFSIPLDANRGISEGIMDIIYETALVGHDDHLIYIDALGYNNINRFENLTEVVEEVMRVVEKIKEMDDAKQK